MGGYLGDWGGLEELRCASSLDVESGEEAFYPRRTSISGVRHAQVRPARPHRVWSVGVNTATPQTMERLAQLAERHRTNATTYAWFPEDALVENMLDPAATFMDPRRWSGITPGGSRAIPLDHATARFLSSGATDPDGEWAYLHRVPIPYGVTVTVSAVVTAYQGATADFTVAELDLTGATIREHTVSTEGTLDRLSHTFTTLGQTAGLTLGFRHANTVAAPQITLTDTVVPWAEGAGCMNAILLSPASKQVQLAVPNLTWGSRSAYSWRIEEIGHPAQGHLT